MLKRIKYSSTSPIPYWALVLPSSGVLVHDVAVSSDAHATAREGLEAEG